MTSIMDVWRYFFPKLTKHQRLRRVNRDLSSEWSIYGIPPAQAAKEIELLRAHGIARTDADAYRILLAYPDTDIFTIIRIEKPQRRQRDRAERIRTRMIKLLLGQNYFRRREKKRQRKQKARQL